MLEARLHACIRDAGGWLPFDDFMAEALYAPGLGYYSRGGMLGTGVGDSSDFVTAPELSPLFGRALARQVAQALRATRTETVIEFGAGSGALAAQLLGALRDEHGLQPSYVIVEVSAALRAEQVKRLSPFAGSVRWWDALPDRLEGVIVGNEVLDAMPVKLLHWDGTQWLERGVVSSVDGSAFHWADRPSALRPPFDHAGWVPGTVTEIHPQAKAWIGSLGERLARGAGFLIDYGFGDAEYYHPQRVGGTLMCHRHHRADTDPLVSVGQKDITAHVNFTAMALALQDCGLEILGYTTQAHFLINCGLLNDLERASAQARVAAQRLFLEHEMGELFKVLAFADPSHAFEPMGFSNGDRSHRL